MRDKMNFVDLIKESAEKKIKYTFHALDEMNEEDEIITTDEVRLVVLNGEIIEDYPDDKRGHSCLMLGIPNDKRPVHVVCAPKDEYLAIYTNIEEMGDRFQNQEEGKMKCLLCKGKMEKTTVSYTVDRKGYHLFVERIPAYVCSQCGERYFDEKETKAIQNLIKTLEEKLQDVLVAA